MGKDATKETREENKKTKKQNDKRWRKGKARSTP